MVEQRLRNIELHLRSLEAQRKSALATGDERRLARAEQFIVQLEAQAAGLTSALAEDQPPTETEQGRRQHILAVNGDPDFLNILRTLLQDERFNVTTTNYVPRTFAQIAAL